MSYSKDYDFKYTKLVSIWARDGAYDVRYQYRTRFEPRNPKRFTTQLVERGFEIRDAAIEGTHTLYMNVPSHCNI